MSLFSVDLLWAFLTLAHIMLDLLDLSPALALQFYRTMVQLLFLCMRSHPNVQTAVSFLTTQVKSPDVDDWGKVRHCVLYLKSTRHMKHYFLADSLPHIHWYVDASYRVHRDSKGHTGAITPMGMGGAY